MKKKRSFKESSERVAQELTLAPQHWEFLKNLGNNDWNRGAQLALDKVMRVYPESTPCPQDLALVLEVAIALIKSGEIEKLQQILPSLQENLEYLQSWSYQQNFQELVAEGVVKIGDSYIA